MPMPGPSGGDELDVGRRALKQLASETGGRFFEVSFLRPIEWIYKVIQEDLRNLYSIGYAPDKPGEAGEFRRIHLTTKKKQVVQTRQGYYTPSR